MTLFGPSAAARLNINCEAFFFKFYILFVFQKFSFSGVCLVRSLSFRSLSFQEFVFQEFVFQEFVFQEFVMVPYIAEALKRKSTKWRKHGYLLLVLMTAEL